MELKIKELRLNNFKGQKEFSLTPRSEMTSVHGTNATGKSTVNDSWLWLWTGKDAQDRADYEIKTRDNLGDEQHRLEHKVTAKIDVDGITYDVERIYKEQWVKPTGEKEQVLKAHTTEFVWDTIPLSKKSEFDMRVNHLFGDMERFKLLSSPSYFLNGITWQKRRALLMELAGVSDSSIMKQLAETSEDFAALIAELKNNTLDDFRKKLNAEKKELKRKIDEIPVKINEATLAIPEEPDYKTVEKFIAEKENELSSIDEQISEISKAYEVQAEELRKQQSVLLDKERKAAKIESDAKIEADRLNREENKVLDVMKENLRTVEFQIQTARSELTSVVSRINNKESEISEQERILEKCREEYKVLSTNSMSEDSLFCPTCGAGFQGDKLTELISAFNSKKARDIENNISYGKRVAANIQTLKNEVAEITNQKNEISSRLNQKQEEKDALDIKIGVEFNRPKTAHTYISIIETYEDYQTLMGVIQTMKENQGEIKQPETAVLSEKRRSVNVEIQDLKSKLSVKLIAENQRQRIKALESNLSTMSQELATIEGKEFVADQFNRSKIEAIENGINGMFASIKWKMFKSLMNGGEEECCEALIEGKPYPAANNAGKVNAGIECINTLSKFYDMYIPIFIDEAESIVSIIPTKSQVIRLVVDENCKTLTVK